MGLFNWVGEALGSVLGYDEPEMPDMSGQTSATQRSLDLAKQIYDQSIATGEPFLTTGQAASTNLGERLGLTGDTSSDLYGSLSSDYSYSDYIDSDAYKFLQDQASQAVERSASAAGSLYAPSTQQALIDYSQNVAGNAYQDDWARQQQEKQDLYSMLSGTSSAGQVQQQADTGAGQWYSGMQSGLETGLADAITSAQLATDAARSNQTSSMWGTVANLASLGLGGIGGGTTPTQTTPTQTIPTQTTPTTSIVATNPYPTWSELALGTNTGTGGLGGFGDYYNYLEQPSSYYNLDSETTKWY